MSARSYALHSVSQLFYPSDVSPHLSVGVMLVHYRFDGVVKLMTHTAVQNP